MIELNNVMKSYQIGNEIVHALDNTTLHIYPNEFVGIIGPSGTLLIPENIS